MPGKYAVFAVCALVPTGCNLAVNATRNLVNEPMQALDNVSLKHQTRSWAKAALRDFADSDPEAAASKDFGAGFIDGYSDYLDNGGNADPPAVPPRRYRRNRYLTPEGHAAIEQYFAGFATGARVARHSGIRNNLIEPVALPPASVGPPPEPIEAPPVPIPPAELPPPRVVPAVPASPDESGRRQPPRGPSAPSAERASVPPLPRVSAAPIAPAKAAAPPESLRPYRAQSAPSSGFAADRSAAPGPAKASVSPDEDWALVNKWLFPKAASRPAQPPPRPDEDWALVNKWLFPKTAPGLATRPAPAGTEATK